MIAQRLPDDDDTPSGWAIVWPLLMLAACLAGSLVFAVFCFVKAYGAN